MFKDWFNSREPIVTPEEVEDDYDQLPSSSTNEFQAPRSRNDLIQEPPVEPITEEPELAPPDFQLKVSIGSSDSLRERAHEESALENIDPIEFENFCARILQRNGFLARVTQASNDHGLDIIAKIDLGVLKLNLGCQCKAYGSQLVGSPEIRNFVGALAQAGLTHGIFFTTSGFSPEAKFAIEGSAKRGFEVFAVDRTSINALSKQVSQGS